MKYLIGICRYCSSTWRNGYQRCPHCGGWRCPSRREGRRQAKQHGFTQNGKSR